MIPKKKILFALFTLAFCQGVNAKVINLTCEFTNVNGGTNTTEISMDTDTQMASANDLGSPQTGKLYSDGEHYWFTANDSLFIRRYQVNRNDLSYSMEQTLTSINAKNMFKGQCKINPKKQKI